MFLNVFWKKKNACVCMSELLQLTKIETEKLKPLKKKIHKNVYQFALPGK